MDERIKIEIEKYNADFLNRWPSQRHLWVDVNQFQRFWDIDANDFRGMFVRATEPAADYLHSSGYTPRAFIINLASVRQEEVRELFRNLYDESVPIATRCHGFIKGIDRINQEVTNKVAYQNMPAVSTYLWLRYPEKYCIFKHELYKEVARRIGRAELNKTNDEVFRAMDFWSILHEFEEGLSGNLSFRKKLKSKLDANCYPDDGCGIAALDLCFMIRPMWAGRKYRGEKVASVTGNVNDVRISSGERIQKNVGFFEKDAMISHKKGKLRIDADKLIFEGVQGNDLSFEISEIKNICTTEDYWLRGITLLRTVPNSVRFIYHNNNYSVFCGSGQALELKRIISEYGSKNKDTKSVKIVNDLPFGTVEEIKLLKHFSMEDIDAISSISGKKRKGDLFEMYCARLLELNLFSNIKIVGGSGDMGVDIIAWKSKKKVAIQCKCYAHTVPYHALEQIVTARKNVMASEGILLSNNYFSEQTKTIAPEHQIFLWDREKLQQLIETANEVCAENMLKVVEASEIMRSV